MKTKSGLIQYAMGLAWLVGAMTAPAAVLTFDTAAEFTGNFYEANEPVDWVADDGGVVRSTDVNNPGTVIYDTTPDTTPTDTFSSPYQVDLDVRFQTSASGSTFGLYFGIGAGRDGLLVLLYNNGGTGSDDLLRFFTGGSVGSASVGSTLFTYEGAYNDSGDWTHMRYIIEEDPDADEITITVAGSNIATPDTAIWSHSYTYTGTDNDGHFGPAEVGVRLSPGAAAIDVDFDNFEVGEISGVPEPSALALMGLGMVVMRLAAGRRMKNEKN